MYSLLFSPHNLYSCTTQSERRNGRLNKEEFAEKVDFIIGEKINEGTYYFNIKQRWDLFLNNHPKDSMEFLCQDLVLRKLYNNYISVLLNYGYLKFMYYICNHLELIFH